MVGTWGIICNDNHLGNFVVAVEFCLCPFVENVVVLFTDVDMLLLWPVAASSGNSYDFVWMAVVEISLVFWL